MTTYSISISVFYLTASPPSGAGKIKLQTGNNFHNHIETVCFTYLNILKMGVQMEAMKRLGSTLYL